MECSDLVAEIELIAPVIQNGSRGNLYKCLLISRTGGTNFGLWTLPDTVETTQHLDRLSRCNQLPSPCFLRIDTVFKCPDIDITQETPATIAKDGINPKECIYVATNNVEYTLRNIQQQLTHYEFKCMLFETIHALNLAKGMVGPVSLDNLVIANITTPRQYRLGNTDYVCYSPYVPLITNTTNIDVSVLESAVQAFSEHAAVHLDLSEKFVNDLDAYMADLISGNLKIEFFSDLSTRSKLSKSMRRLATIEPVLL